MSLQAELTHARDRVTYWMLKARLLEIQHSKSRAISDCHRRKARREKNILAWETRREATENAIASLRLAAWGGLSGDFEAMGGCL